MLQTEINVDLLKENLEGLVAEDRRSAERISLDAGKGRDYIRNILSGRSQNPHINGLRDLAKALKVRVERLIGEEQAEHMEALEHSRIQKERKRMTLVELLISLFQEEYGGESYGQIIRAGSYLSRITDLAKDRSRWRTWKKIQMEPLETRIRHVGISPTIKVVQGEQRLVFEDATGVWRICLDGKPEQVLFLGRVNLNSRVKMEVLIGSNASILALENLLAAGATKLRVKCPKKGMWESTFSYIGDEKVHHYLPWKLNKRDSMIYQIHPLYSGLKADVESFFSNIEMFTRYGGAGARKIMLKGPPGTGKTTIVKSLFADLSDRYTCILADGSSGASFVQVAHSCADAKRPTIVFCEEVDVLRKGAVNSDVLSFLDGVTTPVNPNGTYFIFTTNYPQSIDPRILKRPGRIDKVVHVGMFRSKDAALAAELYLPDDAKMDMQALGRALDRTTPAEIREIVLSTVRYARSTQKELTAELVASTRKQFKEQMSQYEKDDEETPEEREHYFNEFGPAD